jgi:hypothetical protein
MSYKYCRILIVEEQYFRCRNIEQFLSELGYRGFTLATSLRELLALTHYSSKPTEHFDLMIINGELLATPGIDPVRFFQSNSQIRYGVIHESRRGQPKAETIYANHRRQPSLIRTLDRQILGMLLEPLDI